MRKWYVVLERKDLPPKAVYYCSSDEKLRERFPKLPSNLPERKAFRYNQGEIAYLILPDIGDDEMVIDGENLIELEDKN